MHRWYLVHTKSSQEALAKSNLVRQGYGAYLPKVVQPMRCSGRWIEMVTALFPRYVFLQVGNGMQSLAPVRSTPGVADLVSFGAEYAIVPDPVITGLRTREDPDSGLHSLTQQRTFVPGSRVKVAYGPFGGLNGIFERQAGRERVIVLLDLLGGTAPVRMRVDNPLSHAT